MKAFPDYHQARAHAHELARQCKRDAGIYKARDLFTVALLPNPANRTGHELTAEVVTPDEPTAARPQ
jgi:hypothetical protein